MALRGTALTTSPILYVVSAERGCTMFELLTEDIMERLKKLFDEFLDSLDEFLDSLPVVCSKLFQEFFRKAHSCIFSRKAHSCIFSLLPVIIHKIGANGEYTTGFV